MLIILLYIIRTVGHEEPGNEVESPKAQPSTSVEFETGIFGSGDEVLTHCAY